MNPEVQRVELAFPALVDRRYDDRGIRLYRVRPLFRTEPVALSPRFERAVTRLRAHIQDDFSGTRLAQDWLDELFWLRFDPDLAFDLMPIDVTVGRVSLAGKVAVATFSVAGQQFACLPGFEAHFFEVAPRNAGGRALQEELVEQVTSWVRGRKKRSKVSDWEVFLTDSAAFVTPIRVEVAILPGEFGPGPVSAAERYFFGPQMREFSGETELRAVSTELNRRYPVDLRRALLRDPLVESLERALLGGSGESVVLVGPLGSGRTTLVHEALARHLDHRKLSRGGPEYRVFHVDPNRVVAGMSVVGDWERRWEAILDELGRRRGGGTQPSPLRMFVDNPLALLRVGRTAQGALCLADVMKDYVDSGRVRVVLEATPQEWRQVQELDRGFADLFRVIRVPPATIEETVRMVTAHRRRIETSEGTNRPHLTNLGLDRIFYLYRTYLSQRALPGAVVDLVDAVTARPSEAGSEYSFSEVEVVKTFSRSFNFSARIADPDARLEAAEARRWFSARLIGQDEAVEALVAAVLLLKSGLRDPARPVATYLFVGPTGVGKTEAAKVLARFLCAERDSNFIRFDLNTFNGPDAAARLIGSDSGSDGQLTSRVQLFPFCVLLLDEIEKADPSVHDLLLQVLGEGRLTDARGRLVDFTNAIIIMTSNVGAREASQALGFAQSGERLATAYARMLQRTFRPELVNRIDRIVTFRHLDAADIRLIARRQIDELVARPGFARRHTILNLSDAYMERVVALGFDPNLGARALRRRLEADIARAAASVLAADTLLSPALLELSLDGETSRSAVTPLRFARPWVNLDHLGTPEPVEAAVVAALEERLLRAEERVQAAIDTEQRAPHVHLGELYMLRDAISAKTAKARAKLDFLAKRRAGPPPRPRGNVRRRPGRWRVPDITPAFSGHSGELIELLLSRFEAAPEAPFSADDEITALAMAAVFLEEQAEILCGGAIAEALALASLVTGRGTEERDYVTTFQLRMLGHAGLGDGTAAADLSIRDSGRVHATEASHLLRGEVGIHLVVRGTERIVPVIAQPAGDRTAKPPVHGELPPVVRVYCLTAADAETGVLFDLRSGLAQRLPLEPENARVLYYASVAAAARGGAPK
ncbi:MAG: AAA family ATPase [Candidatus Schekmanbacteria bacterium]|nr:AAA family ATPase [Candidatus Schekmanbacteria bacterium]